MSLETLTCQEAEPLITERASGPISSEEVAALERHLAGCLACRAAAERDRTLFALVALAPPGPGEEAAQRGLAERTLAAWRGAERRRQSARVAVLVAAVLLAVAIPLGRWKASGSGPALAMRASLEESELVPGGWASPGWDLDEALAAEAAQEDDSPLSDTLALEGDGAFALAGDNG
jgi:anti-sigma factor RsiW